MLTTRDVAQLLHVSRRRAYELIAHRAIPSVRLGGRIVLPRPAFDAWCEAQVTRALSRCEEDVHRAG